MDTIEQKEKDTIELGKLTRFQKKQVLSLVDRFLEEHEESEKESFPACLKCEMEHRRCGEDTAEREVLRKRHTPEDLQEGSPFKEGRQQRGGEEIPGGERP